MQRVVAQPTGLCGGGAGGGQRVPGALGGVRGAVLHGVEEVGQPSEEPAGLGQRCGVPGAAREDRGVREGGGGRRLGGFGDDGQRGSGARELFDAHLPVDGVDEDGRVEAEGRAGTGARPVPAGGDLACRGGHRAAAQQPVPVGDVVAYLRRGEHQRDRSGQPRALALRHRGGPHAAQRAGPGGTALCCRPAGLGVRQDGHDQAIVIGDHPGELPMVTAQGEAQPAQMGHPLGLEPVGQAVGAGPDDSEHVTRSPVGRR